MKKSTTIKSLTVLAAAFCLTTTCASAWFSGGKDSASATPSDMPPEYRAITNQIAQTQQRCNALIQDVEQTLNAARERLADLRSQEAALNNEIALTEGNIAQLKTVNEARYQELETQQAKLAAFEKNLQEKNARILQLTEAVQAEKIIQQKEEALAALQQKLQEQNAQADALKRELEARKKIADDQTRSMAALEKEQASAQQALADAETANQQLRQRTAELQEQVATLQAAQQNAITGVASTLREFNEFLNTQTNAAAKP